MSNKIFVYIGKILDFSNFDILPVYIKKQLIDIKNQKVINQKKASYALLYKCVNEKLGITDDFSSVYLNNNGKPVSDNYHFSISHSGDLVAVAVSLNNVGIDIQKVDYSKDFNKLKKVILNDNENINILNCDELINLWVQKESCFKFLGDKQFIPQKINTNNLTSYVEKIQFNNESYFLSITADNVKNIELSILI